MHHFTRTEQKPTGNNESHEALAATAASRCEDFQTFRELTPSPSSGFDGGLAEPKLFWNGLSSRKVRKPSHLDAAVCPRKFH